MQQNLTNKNLIKTDVQFHFDSKNTVLQDTDNKKYYLLFNLFNFSLFAYSFFWYQSISTLAINNRSRNSIFSEKNLSNGDTQSADILDIDPFSDFESNFILQFRQEEPLIPEDIIIEKSNNNLNEADSTNIDNEIHEKKRKQKLWGQDEDNRLRQLYETFHGKWNQIVKNMPDRNASQCQQRWRRINPPKKELKHHWTNEDDQKLIELVHKLGKQWMKIAKCLGNISGKQARDRYINKLDNSINKRPWTTEEDLTILHYYTNNGPKWTKISSLLNGRPENHVKNRFYSFIKRNYLGEKNRYQIIYSYIESP